MSASKLKPQQSTAEQILKIRAEPNQFRILVIGRANAESYRGQDRSAPPYRRRLSAIALPSYD